ncbi:ImmA/IrrE family metallo-endopeptidase [Novosphingobium sp.]|uniref:ImmA/IrrE family metallo-endopeptidase n=1 Tax=Novosphingobium sp. TaxID=1874826 RepID=UPI0025CB9A4F|nr:ImmA/IrrE family metallo-endopeptidase [Novosphingobium sp.]
MNISRIDLDGVGSPTALVARILQLVPDLPIPVPIVTLCERLDIVGIEELHTEGFEAALLTDELRSSGTILVAKGRSPQRRRFSIGHELGHFLIPTHLPPPGGLLQCSADQLRMLDTKDQDKRRRMEAEANSFAALLLMPLTILRKHLQRIRQPDISDIVRLAKLFDVSKEAMSRSYVDYSREAIAIVVVSKGRVLRYYRNARHFPWIAIAPGMIVPADSVWHDRRLAPGEIGEIVEWEPDTWLDASSARKTVSMTEQLLGQDNGFSMFMLVAEMRNDDDGSWSDTSRFR